MIGAGRAFADPGRRNLQLEVVVNGTTRNLIGSFVQLEDGRIAALQSELAEIGIKTSGANQADELVVLDAIPSVSYQYDEPAQRISIVTNNDQLVAKRFDLRGGISDMAPARADFGAVVNYDLLTTTTTNLDPRSFAFNGSSLTLDARAFSPYGTLSQSAIIRTIANSPPDVLRLDTAFQYSDQDRAVTYRLGDAITGGLPWTRPIRIGGFQAQRNFGLRPDLVTMPLPVISGSAAVPSTVDLYINNIRTFSQDVGAGPFSLNNVPMVSGGGAARLVVRDSSGHETAITVPFYASPTLLAQDLTSFSAEIGFPRLSFGTDYDTYVASPLGSAILRRGIFDWMTLEAHSEAGAGLVNGGVGAVVKTGSFGVASAAVAASKFDGSAGLQSYLAYETRILGLTFTASSQQTFGTYDDLASVTARIQTFNNPALPSFLGLFTYGTPYTIVGPTPASSWINAKPPRALNRFTVALPLPDYSRSNISASFVQLYDAAGTRSNILSGTWSRSLPYDATIFTTAFSNVSSRKNAGIFVGLSFALNNSISASTSVSSGNGATGITFDAAKPLEQKPGSFGWRVRDTEGQVPYREAYVAYRSPYARIQAGISDDRNGARGIAEVDGAVAVMGGGVFLANRIDDAFAVIQTDVPNVEVFNENRSVGTTDANGRLLVPNLRSYQRNKVSIDTRNLPVDAEIDTSQEIAAPADRAGVIVKFPVKLDTNSAIVVFKQADGRFVPTGSHGQVEGGGGFVVGYDGQAYIKSLAAENVATIDFGDRGCRATFSYTPQPNNQVVISPVLCQ